MGVAPLVSNTMQRNTRTRTQDRQPGTSKFPERVTFTGLVGYVAVMAMLPLVVTSPAVAASAVVGAAVVAAASRVGGLGRRPRTPPDSREDSKNRVERVAAD